MATPAAHPFTLPTLDPELYRIAGIEDVLTPALAIYPEIVDANIAITVGLLGGDPERWRPHVKTAKLAFVMRRFLDQGIKSFKCSTSLELITLCELGAADALIAYPVVGANARRVRAVAEQFPETRVSALVENIEQVGIWADGKIGLFIDVNPGMDRTGIEQDRIEEIVGIARAIESSGLVFRGLHYYDGHLSKYDQAEREAIAHRGYDRLMDIVVALEKARIGTLEIVTAGTPAFPCTLSYPAFNDNKFIHRASPGTVVYGDCTSLSQLPSSYGYSPAALVVSTVVSHPTAQRLTCDAGHKTVSADSGVPTCAVLGRPDLLPSKPSEEHLPIDASSPSTIPPAGDLLYLIPRHICPTVNNFDYALLVAGGRITGVERVTARGREAPLTLFK